MATQLNQNNFLRWTGSFIAAPFTVAAVNNVASAPVNSLPVVLTPLLDDVATLGFDYYSFETTQQANLDSPATWNPITHELTYFLPAGAAPGPQVLKYRFKDANGNQSNEATITITLTARPTGWKAYDPSYACVLDGGGSKTGDGAYSQLQKYYTDDMSNVVPLETKANTFGDTDYIAPQPDANCNNSGYKLWNLAPAFEGGLNACEAFDASLINNYYTYDSVLTLQVGIALYSNVGLSVPAADNSYSDGNMYYTTSGGVIVNKNQCDS